MVVILEKRIHIGCPGGDFDFLESTSLSEIFR